MRYFQNVKYYFAIFSEKAKECDTMTLKDRIKELCNKKGVSMNKVEIDLGFGTGYISKLKESNSNSGKLQKIADYFGVSVDYLMSGKEHEFTIEMADTDSQLIFMEKKIKEYALKLSKLSEDDKTQIMNMIDRLGK